MKKYAIYLAALPAIVMMLSFDSLHENLTGIINHTNMYLLAFLYVIITSLITLSNIIHLIPQKKERLFYIANFVLLFFTLFIPYKDNQIENDIHTFLSMFTCTFIIFISYKELFVKTDLLMRYQSLVSSVIFTIVTLTLFGGGINLYTEIPPSLLLSYLACKIELT